MYKNVNVLLLVLILLMTVLLAGCFTTPKCPLGQEFSHYYGKCVESENVDQIAPETNPEEPEDEQELAPTFESEEPEYEDQSQQAEGIVDEEVVVLPLPNPMDNSMSPVGYAVISDGEIIDERIYGLAACGDKGIGETSPADIGFEVLCLGAPEDVIWVSVVALTWIDPIPGDEVLATAIVGGKFTGATKLIQVALDAAAVGIGSIILANEILSTLEEFPENMVWMASWENHDEGARAIQTLESEADGHRTISKRGDGRSNGSLEIWAKSPTGGDIGGFCIGHVVNNYVVFITIRVPLTLGQVGHSTQTYGGGYYFDPGKLSYDKIWIVSREIGNQTTEDTWLKIGQGGKARYDSLRIKYGYTMPVLRVPLPPNPL
jgi:hypothetical protein